MSDSTNYYRSPHPTHRCGLLNESGGCSHGPLHHTCSQTVDEQPLCYPVRTLEGWFKVFGIVITLSATLALLVVLPSWKSNAILAPGPLAQAHAQLLHNVGHEHSEAAILANQRCAACHPIALNAEEKRLLLLSHSRDGKEAPVGLQSQLCLNCHQDNMPKAREGTPHDLVGDDLQRLLVSVPNSQPTELARQTTECSQCHQEHRSDGKHLDHITSQRCQACHQNQFESFSHGHPEFDNFPIPEPRKIAFDHTAHRDMHFAKKNKQFDCRICHVSDGQSGEPKNVFRSVSFEKACASCHTESLINEATDGVVVLQLPNLDKARLAQAGIDIGTWPESASQIMEGELSSLWKELIRSEERGAEILDGLPASGKLSDVNWDNTQELVNIALLTESMRRALKRIAEEGQPRIKKAIEEGVRKSANGFGMATSKTHPSNENWGSDAWLTMYASGFPIDVVRLANERWFSNDLDNNQSKSADAAVDQDISMAMPGARIRQPKPKQPPGRVLDPRGDLHSTGPLAPGDELTPSVDSLADENLLADDLLVGGADEDLLGSGDLLNGTIGAEQTAAPVENLLQPLRGWEHMPFGGWMLDDTRVALVYIPKTHADGWLSRWIEWEWLSGTLVSAAASKQSIGVTGQCIECHSMNTSTVRSVMQMNHSGSSDSSMAIEAFQKIWRIERNDTASKGIHKFNHSPHMTIASLTDCRSCHILPAGSTKKPPPGSNVLDNRSEIVTSNISSISWTEMALESSPHRPFKEFTNMSKVLCASCHQSGLAGDNCTQCHNYHVNSFHTYPKASSADHQLQAAQELWHWTKGRR